jgi:acyl carrier protein
LLSGERLNTADLAQWFETLGEGVRLVNLWGTSETTLAKTFHFISPADVKRERIPVGNPLPGARVAVLNSSLEICDTLVTGELYIKTPFRTAGYYNDADLNRQRFIPDPFADSEDEYGRLHKTGDLGRFLPDGTIDVLGRNDRQVKVRGIRVELEGIESVLNMHPLVSESVILKKDIAAGDSWLCGYVVTKTSEAGEEDDILAELDGYLSSKLPAYMVPGKLLKIDQMPRLASGKIDYRSLPDPLAIEKVKSPPMDEIEERLCELWCAILGLEDVGVTDNFFELGGNSLNIMNLITRIHRDFDIRIPLGDVFNNPTIRAQAVILRGKQDKEIVPEHPERFETIPVSERRQYYPCSSAQKRLYFLQQFENIGTSYNMPTILNLEGGVQRDVISNTFQRLIQRHESLRTSFHIHRDEPVQIVHDSVDFKVEYLDLTECESENVEIGGIISSFIAPFDLSRAPLMRASLVKQEDRGHVLMFDMHHIISDGTSLGILSKDLTRLYAGENLPPLTVQYKDFASWQNRLVSNGGIASQEAYWLELYRDRESILPLNMPTDFPRPETISFEGDCYHFGLDPGLTSAVKRLASEHGATIYMNLMTALNVLLYKYTGQQDIIVGSGIMGRPHADLEPIIGMFVNSLALRNRPEPGKTYSRFLDEVKESSIKAFENQDVQFELLVDKLGIPRHPSRNPLFDVLFVVQNFTREIVEAKGVSFGAVEHEQTTTKFDLTFFAFETGGEILFELQYAVRLFKPESIKMIARHFTEVLEQAAANPRLTLEEFVISDRLVAVKTEDKQAYETGFDF